MKIAFPVDISTYLHFKISVMLLKKLLFYSSKAIIIYFSFGPKLGLYYRVYVMATHYVSNLIVDSPI